MSVGTVWSGDLDISSDAAYNVLCGDPLPDPSDENVVMCALARRRWLAYSRLLADLWATTGDHANVGETGFAFFGLLAMRDALEFDPAVVETQKDVEMYGPRDLLLETASVWVVEAGERMYESRQEWNPDGEDGALKADEDEDGADDGDDDFDATRYTGKGGARWSGINGYAPGRWALWKQVFKEVGADAERRSNVVAAAKVRVFIAIEVLIGTHIFSAGCTC